MESELDFQLRTIDLDLQWDADKLPMLMAHPHLDFHDVSDGFRLPEAIADNQVRLLSSMLELAGKYSIPLVLLPEYALPSGRFHEYEKILVRNLPPGAMCMAGLDAMGVSQWQEIRQGAANKAALERVENRWLFSWVNAAVVWVRQLDGCLTYFLQPKLWPSLPERSGMLRGGEVLLFQISSRGQSPWTLSQLICYDFIAPPPPEPRTVVSTLLTQLGQGTVLDLLVVLQANDKPHHDDFQHGIRRTVNPDDPEAAKYATVRGLALVNMAWPCSEVGSGFFFAEQLWKPLDRQSALDKVPRVHRRKALGAMKVTNASFRCTDPCVHLLKYWRPRLPHDPVRAAYLQDAYVARIAENGTLTDHEKPSALEHAVDMTLRAVHPVGEQAIVRLLGQVDPSIVTELQSTHGRLRKVLLDHSFYDRLIEMAEVLVGIGQLGNPDNWIEREYTGLERLLELLYILPTAGFALGLGGDGQHAIAGADGAFTPNGGTHPFRKITARAHSFTLDVLAGDPKRYCNDLVAEYLADPGRDLKVARLTRPHLCMIMQAEDPVGKLQQVDPHALRRNGAGGVRGTARIKEGNFGPEEGEEGMRLGQPPLYHYTWGALCQSLRDPSDRADLSRRLKEVLACLVA